MCGDIMVVDLSSLLNTTLSSIEVNDKVIIPEEYYKNTDIVSLKDLVFDGNISVIENEADVIGTLKGVMVLNDSISLEEINYPFSVEIDEEIEDFSTNSTNTLDITDILWQNIVLEVPLKLTNVTNFDEYCGDGWKLVSEDSISNTNNPFKELEDMLGKEWYYGSTIQKSIKN